MMGPVLFGSVLLALSALEYAFMLGIGWQPIADPAGAWLSALALGPYPCPAAGDGTSNHSDILPANYLGALGSPSDKSLRHVASELALSPHYFSESCYCTPVHGDARCSQDHSHRSGSAG